MAAYEQRVEPPDKKWQYLLFAAEPYETIAFKVALVVALVVASVAFKVAFVVALVVASVAFKVDLAEN